MWALLCLLGSLIICAVLQRVSFAQPAFYLLLLIAGCLFLFYRGNLHGMYKAVFGCVAFCLSMLFLGRFLPGFKNFFVGTFDLKTASTPFAFYWNIDKPLLSLFILVLAAPARMNWQQFKEAVRVGGVCTLYCVATLIPLALILKLTIFKPEVPLFFFTLLVRNLIFVVLVEEVFFRLFLQKALYEGCAALGLKPIMAVFVIASLFGFGAHMAGGLAYAALASLAGFFYAYAFHKTKRIEASCCVHFYVNTLHMLLFAYPLAA